MKKALLIIDIQNDYFTNGAMPLIDSELACENSKYLLDDFRQKEAPVIYIQHIATRADATFFLPNTEGVEIHKMISPLENEKIVIKHSPNSFMDTDLLEYLKANNITDLVICGMMTHMCVDATIRAAKDLGFVVSVIGDACATKDLDYRGEVVRAKEVQNSFLSSLSYFYSTVLTTTEYLNL